MLKSPSRRELQPSPQLPDFYTGPELDALCLSHPIVDLLPGRWARLMEEGLTNTQAMALFGSSPFANAQTETLLGELLTQSVIRNRWVGARIGDGAAYQLVQQTSEPAGDLTFGTWRGLKAGLCGVYLDAPCTSTYFLPNEQLLEYVHERLTGKKR